ncbi:MAG: winged helix DNA-binding domain-containing protein [Anaerolineales bacterium]
MSSLEPTIKLTRLQARRFLLAHHSLWPPRKLKGKQGVIEYIRSVGTIQFDPINVVGRNADLVLQSRIYAYTPELLHELLYEDRKLLDGFDKVASIYETADWPYFQRRRDRMRAEHGQPSNPGMKIADEVIEAIREDGPKSSIDFKSGETIKWNWGVNTSLPRACLEILYAMGEVVVHDRVGTRRYFELAERALPRDVFAAPDPNSTTENYQDWHVMRRIGGLGIANPAAGDWWLGLNQVKSPQRNLAINRLVDRGKLTVVEIEDIPGHTFLIRAEDMPTLDRVRRGRPPKARAAFIGALDNLMWDRNMLRWVFDFDYTWEVYKPAAQRQYGYYVLPVLYGDRFVARMDPSFDRERRELSINNWWWEDGIEVSDEMQSALVGCLKEFMVYLGADRLKLGAKARRKPSLGWVQSLQMAA